MSPSDPTRQNPSTTSVPFPPRSSPASLFPIVALGASAGGLEALQSFFTHMPPDSGAAFVVVTHQKPGRRSLLPEILERCCTQMPVTVVEENMEIRPDQVFVIPPGRIMTLEQGHFRLTPPDPSSPRHHPVDAFFRSLACDAGDLGVAVVLSGAGDDGAQGIQAVRDAGGLTIAQDADSAAHPSMPRSAAQTGDAEAVLPPQEIPPVILRHARGEEVGLRRRERQARHRRIETILPGIGEVLAETLGQGFGAYKKGLQVRRVERRLAALGLSDPEHYLERLRESPEESRLLARDLLVGVTSFFRDPEAFEHLSATLLRPLLRQAGPGDPLRVWVPACSTGEEAYSLAMLLAEEGEQHLRRVQIFATDINPQSVEKARLGYYPAGIEGELTPERLERFFVRENGRYRVKYALRDRVVFAPHDLLCDPPFSGLNLICCRNLLIYLDAQVQDRLLSQFHRSLKPDGVLFLGSAESVGAREELFEALDKRWRIFRRRESGRTALPPSLPPRGTLSRYLSALPESGRQRRMDVGQAGARAVLERYAPPSILVNQKGDALHYYARTSPFLEQPVGESTMNILQMARPELRPALRAALHQAFSEERAVDYPRQAVFFGEERRWVDLRVELLQEPAALRGLALVVFSPSASPPPPDTAGDSQQQELVRRLEEQLEFTDRQLQETLRDYEQANEELMSSNEELISLNEELQSTNEELETGKEELQALNEELIKVNAELQIKVVELDREKNDGENLITSSRVATLFLDKSFRVQRFTPAVADLFAVGAEAQGRLLSAISPVLGEADLLGECRRVLETLKPVEREVRGENGRVLQLRILPYRTLGDRIEGVVLTFADITELKAVQTDLARQRELAEERAREAEEGRQVLRLALGAGEMGIWDWQLKDDFVVWDDTQFRLFGVEPTPDRKLSSSHIFDRIHPEDLPAVVADLDRLKEQGGSYQNEFRVPLSDGSERWIAARGRAVRDDQGRTVRITGVNWNVTARRETQETLRAQQELLQAIIDHIPVMLTIYDPHLNRFRFNDAFHRTLGWTLEDVGSGDPMELFYPDPPYREEVRRFMLSLDPGWRDFRVTAKSGEAVESSWANIRLSDDTQIGIGIDIRDRKAAEAALSESESRFRETFENAAVGIAHVGPGGEWLHVNQRLCEIVGYSWEELLQKTFMDITHPEDLAKDLDQAEKLRRGEIDAYRMEKRYLHRDGHPVWVNLTGSIRRNETGEPLFFIAVVEDIGLRKALEIRLREAKTAAEEGSRAKSEFLANMSHEIRTPMTVVLAALEQLREFDGEPHQEKLLEMADNSARRLLSLIDDILDFSRIEARKTELIVEPFDLKACVGKAAGMFELKAQEKGLELKTSFAPDLPALVLGDADRLGQILVNLVGNAVKFTQKGEIEVRVETGEDRLYFSVRDTGIGIPAEKENLLFQNFSQVDSSRTRKYGGTGLGLAICRGLVELMGGSITVKSREGSGSIFRFTLPLRTAEPSREASKDDHAASSRTPGTIRILLAEDDPMVRDLVGLILGRRGWNVTHAETGEEAWQLWQRGSFDVVIMDVQMPGMDGLEATRRIRHLEEEQGLRRTPIIALTAHARLEDREECLASGMDECLTKPVNMQQLYAAVDACLGEVS